MSTEELDNELGQERREWLENLSVGDPVVLCKCAQRSMAVTEYSLTTISTVCEDGALKVAEEGSGTFYFGESEDEPYVDVWIRVVDQETLDKIERRALISKLSDINWNEVGLEKMREIGRMMDIKIG